MFLKRLEISGFKSFAHHANFVFEPGLTAIVGPNGSGKSNVTDALRWVFGEQKQSLLRGKKADDVIFAGSDKKARLNLAEVTAVFDNTDKKMPIDASEVALTRRVDRSGNSEYLINNSQVKLQDLSELILQSGIGTSQTAVISQGTVEHLVSGGPVELKNMIDEACGVRIYYIRRNKAWKRLEQTADNLQRARERLSELEPRLKLLRRQVEKYNQRESIEQKLKDLQREWYFAKSKTLFEQLQSVEQQDILRLQNEESLNAHILELKKQLSALSLVQTALEERRDILQKEEIELRESKHALQERRAVLNSQIEMSEMSRSGENIHAKVQQLTSKKFELTTKIIESQKTISQQKAERDALTEKISSIRKKIDENLEIGIPEKESFGEIARQIDQLAEDVREFENRYTQTDNVHSIASELIQKFHAFYQRTKKLTSAVLAPQTQEQTNTQDLQREFSEVSKKLSEISGEMEKDKLLSQWLEKELRDTESSLLALHGQIHRNSGETSERDSNELSNIAAKIAEIESKITAVIEQKTRLQQEEFLGRTSTRAIEQELLSKQMSLEQMRKNSTDVLVEKTRIQTLLEQVRAETVTALGEEEWDGLRKKIFENTPTPQDNEAALQKQIISLQGQLESIGTTDELTIQEHREVEEDYTSLKEQVEDLAKSSSDLRIAVEELDEKINQTFTESFEKINRKFQEYFQLLFNGGKSILAILYEETAQSEEEDIQTSKTKVPTGIDIKATPPGKKLASVHALSGGERALTAIALLCAMIASFPAPIVVLDEADAALDEANTVRFGQILSSLSLKTQFVTVTHNRETMAKADCLYGVTMGQDGISKVLSIKLDQAANYAK